MVFTPKFNKTVYKDLDIYIRPEQIYRVYQCQMGVILDNRFSWKHHTACVANKVAKTTGLLVRAKTIMSTESIRQLYFSFAYPLMLYCNIIWRNCNKNHLLIMIKTNWQLYFAIFIYEKLRHP